MILDGVDTSHYQQFTSEQLPPMVFAVHKAAEGRGYHDPTFQSAVAEYRRRGVPLVGAYHFTLPDIPAADQFANFKAQCASVGGVDFWMQDWERDQHSGRCAQESICWDFEQRCRDWNPRGFMYSASWVTDFAKWLARPNRVPLWNANYSAHAVEQSTALGAVVLQWTSTLWVPGITTNGIKRCDANTILDHAAWNSMFGTSTQPPTPTEDTTMIETKVQWIGGTAPAGDPEARPEALVVNDTVWITITGDENREVWKGIYGDFTVTPIHAMDAHHYDVWHDALVPPAPAAAPAMQTPAGPLTIELTGPITLTGTATPPA